MDATTLNTIVGIIGIVVGVIGIIVGMIGWGSLSEAKKIRNTANADNGSTIMQAEVINQGISEDTVRLITKDMTKEQMCRLIIRLVPIHTDDENCVGNRLRQGNVTADQFEEILNSIPTTYYGKNKPPGFPYLKSGDIYCEID